MNSDAVVIVGGARTAMAEYAGTPGYGLLAGLSAIELGAHAARGALQRANVIPEQVTQVCFGNVLQSSVDALYGARHVALKAGVPIPVPALTVNRLCGSGLEALVQAARWVRDGEADIVLAGGMENMSQAPHAMYGQRGGIRLGSSPQLSDTLFEALKDPFCGFFMAQTAENLAKKHAISRSEQDEFALRSHRLGAHAVEAGIFAEEIVPIVVPAGRGQVTVQTDDHVKPDTSAEKLAALRPAFGKDGSVTAGNASGIVDGAAALVVTSARKAQEYGLEIWAEIRAWSVVGVPPEIMGIGPVPAIRKVLERTGRKLDEVDFFEINEAFAAQYLACEKELGLDRDKVNVNGGAIALGHPLGATGARLALTLCHQLRRAHAQVGIASACIGGGQGIALLLERP
jgi:acetyl-CoA acetyltransferase family protein